MQRTPEDSEELRLSLCQMVGRMITTLMARDSIGVIGPYLDDIILFLVSNSNDVYSPVKVEALAILAKLAVHPQLEQVKLNYLHAPNRLPNAKSSFKS